VQGLRDRYGVAFLVISRDLDTPGAVGEQVPRDGARPARECGRSEDVIGSPPDPTLGPC
jgi:hypothetical protein